jgi:polysaccharide deacetylase 2 family uncharacterized protein YibQ
MNPPIRLRFLVIFMVCLLAVIGLMDWMTFGSDDSTSGQKVTYETSLLSVPSDAPQAIEPAAGKVNWDILPEERITIEPEAIEVSDVPNLETALEGQYEQTPEEEQATDIPVMIPPMRDGMAKVSIIIDDVGMNHVQSQVAVELPAAVTLAILPYAEAAPDFAKAGIEAGHELLIHTPMEASNPDVDLGALALRSDDTPEEFNAMFDKILNSFDGYIGINNHMGSKLTQDEVAMQRVMKALKSRGLAFVDSRTIHTSVAEDVAAQNGVAHAVRDVFLDHEDTDEFLQSALKKLEKKALQNGHAIAIGHPKEVTMRNLHAWIPTLQEKGIELVPISELLVQPAAPVAAPIDSVYGPTLPLPPG